MINLVYLSPPSKNWWGKQIVNPPPPNFKQIIKHLKYLGNIKKFGETSPRVAPPVSSLVQSMASEDEQREDEKEKISAMIRVSQEWGIIPLDRNKAVKILQENNGNIAQAIYIHILESK
jgi:hypothetical protein